MPGNTGAIQAWIRGGSASRGLNFRALSGRVLGFHINYRDARLIAWLMFQTLLRRSALAAVLVARSGHETMVESNRAATVRLYGGSSLANERAQPAHAKTLRSV